jgi:hypothetical protein
MAGVDVMLANQLFEFNGVSSADHRDDFHMPVTDFFGCINIGPVFVEEEVQFEAELFGKKNNLGIAALAE